MKPKKFTLCYLFGHSWTLVYIGKRKEWSIIACFCSRCGWGHQDILNTLDRFGYGKGYDFGSYDEKYFMEKINEI